MFAWIATRTGLSLLGSKIAFFGVVSLVIFCVLNFTWYRNRLINQGVAEGRTIAQKEIVKAKQAEWQAREDQIAAAGTAITAAKTELEAQRLNLNRLRSSLQNSFQQSLASIAAGREANYADVARVRDADLDAALRAISASLAAGTKTATPDK